MTYRHLLSAPPVPEERRRRRVAAVRWTWAAAVWLAFLVVIVLDAMEPL